jgi:predicted nucleic acid-binding protein
VIIVDASVAVKWYFPEAGSNDAISILDNQIDDLIAPEIFAIEVNAALVRKGNMDKPQSEGIRLMITDFEQKLADKDIRLVRTDISSLATAANLAINIGHPLKDCIYLTLAMVLECELLTCDVKFADKAKGVWDRVRVLGN